MNAKPLVSAIIVNRNGAGHLRICVPSLRAQSYQPIEIIVVDNASTDDSAEVAKQCGARWIGLDSNIGLAPALNRGAESAKGELLLFVNNDMRFDPDFVANLREALLQEDTIFAADGMQYDWEGTKPGHLATHLATNAPQTGFPIQLVPGLYMWQEQTAKTSPALMASAACMLVRKKLFEEIGRFEERLPLSYEDLEICWRAWTLGWKTVYVPRATCWHRVGSSCRSDEGSRLLFKGILKGRLLFSAKMLPARYFLLTWLLSAAGIAKDLVTMRWRTAVDRCEVLIQYATYIPALLREKRELYARARTTPERQLQELLRLSSNDHDEMEKSVYELEGQWKRAG